MLILLREKVVVGSETTAAMESHVDHEMLISTAKREGEDSDCLSVHKIEGCTPAWTLPSAAKEVCAAMRVRMASKNCEVMC